MPVTRHDQDPWSIRMSKRGFACDELVSALQKYIRRSETHECLLVAREMYETSEELAEHLWQRLVIIASSDVWAGGIAPVVVETLRNQSLRQPWLAQNGWLQVAAGVRYLCETPKDMTTEDMSMWGYHVMTSGRMAPSIPDYALDNHTKRGQDAGRGVRYFLDVGCQVRDEVPRRDGWYRREVEKFVRDGEWRE